MSTLNVVKEQEHKKHGNPIKRLWINLGIKDIQDKKEAYRECGLSDNVIADLEEAENPVQYEDAATVANVEKAGSKKRINNGGSAPKREHVVHEDRDDEFIR